MKALTKVQPTMLRLPKHRSAPRAAVLPARPKLPRLKPHRSAPRAAVPLLPRQKKLLRSLRPAVAALPLPRLPKKLQALPRPKAAPVPVATGRSNRQEQLAQA
jgi:hypothetical protein